MLKRIFIVLFAGMFVFGISEISFAMTCGCDMEHKQKVTATDVQAKKEKAVNVGNKTCPVTGEKIKEGEAYQLEYEGKIYNLCCEPCSKEFKKDPQKYIKKIETMEKEEQQKHKH